MEPLDEEALVKILTEPKNAIVKQYQKLFELDHVELEFTEGAVREIAKLSAERKTGARGLRSILEKAMTNLMYELPSNEEVGRCLVTEEVIRGTGEPELTIRDVEVPREKRRISRKDSNEIA